VSSAGKLFLLLSNSTLQQGEKQEKKKKRGAKGLQTTSKRSSILENGGKWF